MENGRLASPMIIVKRFTLLPMRSDPAVRLVLHKAPLAARVDKAAVNGPRLLIGDQVSRASPGGAVRRLGAAVSRQTVVSNGLVVASNSVTGVSSLKYSQRCRTVSLRAPSLIIRAQPVLVERAAYVGE